MRRINHRMSLDIQDTAAPYSMSIKKGDSLRRLVITLMENGQPYQIEDCTAQFALTNHAGETTYNSCAIQDNTIIYDVTAQDTSITGTFNCEIILRGTGGAVLTSPHFKLVVY